MEKFERNIFECVEGLKMCPLDSSEVSDRWGKKLSGEDLVYSTLALSGIASFQKSRQHETEEMRARDERTTWDVERDRQNRTKR